MQQRVLVCGGRDYENRDRLNTVLDAAHCANPIVCLIHGASRGADTLAANWARSNGVPCESYHADWDRDRKAAGPIRNQKMLDEGKPHLVIAFPGGAGTADMIRRAKKAGVPVVTVRPGAHAMTDTRDELVKALEDFARFFASDHGYNYADFFRR